MIEITSLASGSGGNAYKITDGVTTLLLECGIPYRNIQKGLNFQMSSVAACLISHRHSDHCKAIKDVAKAGIDIYIAQEEKEAIGITHHRVKGIKALEQFKVGTWTVLPFEVQHDTENPLGFLLVNEVGERLLFATDTYYIKNRFKDLNFILVECNYSLDILNQNVSEGLIDKGRKKRLMRSHFSLENVKEFLLANDLSKVQEIWLLHLSDTNSDADLFKKEIQELTGKMVFVP